MNERIKQLAEQATEIVETTDHCSGKSESTAKVNLAKFAELIVRECLSYAKDGDIDFMKFMIKQHFGVE